MQNTHENEFLGKEKISKLLVKFSIPCILSLLITALYNIVDQIFIGNSELGYLGNAATGIVFPLIIITHAFAWCCGDGAAVYLSICQGKGDTVNSHKGVGNGVSFTMLCCVVIMVVFFSCKKPLLMLFGATETTATEVGTLNLAVEYFNIVIAALPIYMFANCLNGVIRADGSPAYSMLTAAAGAIVNIILDPIFIFGCKWGIKGAAWATVIGQAVSFTLTLIYLFKTKTFKLRLSSFKFSKVAFGSVMKIGASTFITQMSIVVISLVCNVMLAKYGAMSKYGANIPISVISIETKVFTVIINIVVGIILGGQPILGYNNGARNYDRVRETYKLIFIATLAVGLISTLLIEVFPHLIVGIFGSTGDALYMDFAVKTFRIFLMLVTFTCFAKMTSIFFQALGQPVRATVASLIRDIICFIPLVIALPAIFENDTVGTGVIGVLFAAPIADFIAMIISTALTISFFKKLKKEEKTQSLGNYEV